MKADRGEPVSATRRAILNRGFLVICLAATSMAVIILAVLIVSITVKGLPWIVDAAAIKATFSSSASGAGEAAGSWKGWIRWEFFTEYTSYKAKNAGILAPLIGSIWAVAICSLLALPIGVGTAVYLEEFAPRNRLTRLIETNIRNLAGVPSIVYGILGLSAFARMFGAFGSDGNVEFGNPEQWYYLRMPFGQSVLAGGLTLMLVILPIIIIASQESFRAIPKSLRQASLAMGATQWQTVWNVSLPAAIPMVLTGAILAVSRAVGEAAPLLVLGVPAYIASTPNNLMSDFTVLPFQIYTWAGRPQDDFRELAAAAIIVLLVVLLSFNAIAVLIRQKLHRQLT